MIGGLGGSGTRLPAQLLRELGFYLGDDLNDPLDNLWFALLFRRPTWRREHPAQVPIALNVFEQAMRGRVELSPAETRVLRGAVDGSSRWALERARSLRASKGPPADSVGWGWKNPSTHIYIEQLAAAFPGMKYIFMIRDPLELIEKAKTRLQVETWGSIFDLDLPGGIDQPAPQTTLRYWLDANRRVLRLGGELLDNRLLTVRYHDLCERPAEVAATVAEFLELELSPSAAARFASFVEAPPSGRRPASALDVDAATRSEVESLGFTLGDHAGRR